MRLIRWSVLALLFLFPASIYPRTRAVDRPGEEPNPPRLVSFSGQLAHIAGKGEVGVSFAIYKEAEGGTPLWIETQNVEVDEAGRFTVNLGAATEGGIRLDLFTSGEARWLSIQRIPEVEQPRILLASVAYALKAADAETLGGKPLSSFVLGDETNSVLQKDGTRTLKPKVNTSGTTNYIGKFTDSTNLGNSILYDTGAAVGLLTTSPSAPLHINSVMTYRAVNVGSLQTGAFPGVMFENTTTGTSGLISENNGLIFFTRGNSASFVGSDQRMIITSTGRVGIGTNAPQGPLHIGTISTYRNLNVGSIQTGAYPGIMLENTATNVSVALTENNGFRLFVRPSASTAFQNADMRLIVDTSGNVGIGTSTPGSALDVVGDVNLSGNLKLPATASASAGVITLGGARFAHAFGTSSTSLGVNAGNFTMTGANNTFVGASAGSSTTTGPQNTAVGFQALMANTLGDSNTALGHSALTANIFGTTNTAVGWNSLLSNTNGGYNTGLGGDALFENTTGGDNTAIGYAALGFNNGSDNIAIGSSAGQSHSTGNHNIYLGHLGVSTESDAIHIGNTHTKAFIAGIRGVTTVNADAVAVLIDSAGQLGTTSSSRRYKFDIHDMAGATDGLMRLRPVTFRYLAHGDSAPIQYGLIAEEVADVYPEMVARNKDGEVETVMYQFLPPMLLNELQKQRRTIEEQRQRIDEQQKTLDALQRALQALGQQFDSLKTNARQR